MKHVTEIPKGSWAFITCATYTVDTNAEHSSTLKLFILLQHNVLEFGQFEQKCNSSWLMSILHETIVPLTSWKTCCAVADEVPSKLTLMRSHHFSKSLWDKNIRYLEHSFESKVIYVTNDPDWHLTGTILSNSIDWWNMCIIEEQSMESSSTLIGSPIVTKHTFGIHGKPAG